MACTAIPSRSLPVSRSGDTSRRTEDPALDAEVRHSSPANLSPPHPSAHRAHPLSRPYREKSDCLPVPVTLLGGSRVRAKGRPMETVRRSSYLHDVRTLHDVGSFVGLTDVELLARFTGRRRRGRGVCVLGPGGAARADGAGRLPAGAAADRRTPRTPSRRRSWSWRGRPGRSARANPWRAGCTAWRTGPRPAQDRRGPAAEA